jgi:hypothetical protein
MEYCFPVTISPHQVLEIEAGAEFIISKDTLLEALLNKGEAFNPVKNIPFDKNSL